MDRNEMIVDDSGTTGDAAMTLDELLLRSRSYRRFHQDRPLDQATLVRLVELVRRCPSAANRQPLKFLVSWQPERNARIFPHLRWAAALKPVRDRDGPPS